MGRLVNIKWFLGDEAYAQERADFNQIRRLAGMKNSLTAPDELQELRMEISTRHREHFQGRILCRSPGTLGRDGKPLVPLPPKYHITLELDPTDREKEIFATNADEIKEE